MSINGGVLLRYFLQRALKRNCIPVGGLPLETLQHTLDSFLHLRIDPAPAQNGHDEKDP